VAAIANGGTLYYLQHPTTPDEAAYMTPRSSAPSTCQVRSRSARRHGRRSRVWNRPPPPRQLQPTARLRQNRHCSDNGTRFGCSPPIPTRPRAAWSPSSSSRADAPPLARAAELTGGSTRISGQGLLAQKDTSPTAARRPLPHGPLKPDSPPPSSRFLVVHRLRRPAIDETGSGPSPVGRSDNSQDKRCAVLGQHQKIVPVP